MNRRRMAGGLALGALAMADGRRARAEDDPAAVVAAFWAATAAGEYEAAAGMLAEDYDPHAEGDAPGRAAWLQRQLDGAERRAAAFARAEYAVEAVVGEGAAAAARVVLSLETADGKAADVLALGFYRVADGLIAEGWSLADTEAATQLLGGGE